jgi:signal transduction histidine kinase/ActR/RegA family two-component response regulator
VLSATCDVVRDTRSKIIGMLVIARDVTERRRADEERAALLTREQSARQEAEAANRAKDEFLAMLSHELRTPLSSMMGWVTLLRSGQLDESTATRALEVVDRNLKLQRQLIEDLLDVSRIITGKMPLALRPVHLVGVIEAAVDTLRPAATAKGIKLEMAIEPLVPLVAGDPNRLQQVVWNLVSNAIKFTPGGGRVSVRLHRLAGHAVLSVEDTGKGISAEFLPHVFERFRQADSSSTRTYGGLGLGLAIVRHLVELHGGMVSAASPGEDLGSTFTVSLPLVTLVGLGERGDPAAGSGAPAVAEPRPSLRGARVLVVEDTPDERQLLTAILAQHGAEVVAVGSVEEAVEAFREARPDVLVSDIAMPGQNGFALIHQVRTLERAQGGYTPAIALTAYAGGQDQRRILIAGFQLHMAKPVEPADLVAAVASLSGRNHRV